MTWLDQIPLLLVFVITALIVLGSIGGGYATGNWRSSRTESKGEGAVGSAVAAMLALQAFILAFTFGTTTSRFDTRRQLLLNEVNAIGTAALRADLLPEPHRSRIKELLKSYVRIRAEQPTLGNIERLTSESDQHLDQLWAETTAVAKVDMDSPLRALFVQSMNEVIDLQTSRVTVGMYQRVPSSIWVWLIGSTACGMFAVGYQFGCLQQKRMLIHVLLALLLSSVVVLIVDLDRAGEGTVTLNFRPMIELSNKLNAN